MDKMSPFSNFKLINPSFLIIILALCMLSLNFYFLPFFYLSGRWRIGIYMCTIQFFVWCFLLLIYIFFGDKWREKDII